jgi:hypothetical protein
MNDTYTVLPVAIERLYFQKLYCDKIDTNVQLKMRASTAPLIFVKITHQNYVERRQLTHTRKRFRHPSFKQTRWRWVQPYELPPQASTAKSA